MRNYYMDSIAEVQKSNFDFPFKLANSITTAQPLISFFSDFKRLETQFTVPPVASKSSTIAKFEKSLIDSF